jgi:tetratricopeptide (TPR) repeat protein
MKGRTWIALGLLVATMVAYGPLRENGFVGLDDPEYVTKNPNVLAGLTGGGFSWAFNVGYTGNWHPLTWISHQVDVSLWGLDPAAHHTTSLVLHALSTLLLFLFLARATGRDGPSAFVAAVFAVHPLHVESVAWVAERKDVLSTLLGFGSLLLWVEWAAKAGRGRYLGSLGLFAASLAAKPMFVTLPFLLVLLDRWPLERKGAERLREKLPFFALAAASCVLTVIAQSRGKAVSAVASLPLELRAMNALSAYLAYFAKACWPAHLAVFYPYPLGGAPALEVLGGGALLAAGTFAAFRFARRLPWLATGWLWWVGMLVPVIGIVQVGGQSMADRYTYVPMVGLSIAFAWGAAELLSRLRPGRAVGWAAGLAVLVACVGATRAQVALWKDDETLFRHALESTDRNYLAHLRLAGDAWEAGRREEALAHFAETVRLAPDMPEAHNNYGAALLVSGRADDALVQLQEAVRLEPDVGDARINLAGALLQKGRIDEAITQLQEGVRLRPDLEDKRRFLEQLLRSRAQAPSSK